MAANLERLAKDWQGKYSQIASGLNNLAKQARGSGAPESFNSGKNPEAKPILTKTENSQDLVRSAVAEYQKGPLTPELLTKTFQTIWKARREVIGQEFEVTPCPFTQEELADLEKKGLRLSYLPKALSTQADRFLLGKMFPEIQSSSVQKENSVTSDRNPSGWFDYEAAIDAPYLGTNENKLIKEIKKKRRMLLNENQYIVAGQDSKLFAGRYLDERGTWVRVGSRSRGHLVLARFPSDGDLYVDSGLAPRDVDPNLGGRSSGVNRA